MEIIQKVKYVRNNLFNYNVGNLVLKKTLGLGISFYFKQKIVMLRFVFEWISRFFFKMKIGFR